jgi:integrase/recombinase XerD
VGFVNFLERKQGTELLRNYLKNFEGKSSLKVYRAEIKQFFRFCTCDLSELNGTKLTLYRDHLVSKGFTESTLKRKFSILNGFFRFIEERTGWKSPFDGDLQKFQYVNYADSKAFGKLLNGFSATLRSEKTASQYNSIIRLFFSWVGKKPQELTHTDFAEYKAELLDTGKMTATIINKFLAINAFLKFIFTKDPVKNPLNMKALRLPSMPRGQGLANTLDESEIEQLLSRPDIATGIGKRDYIMLTLMVRLGLRVSEVCNLRFRDIAERVQTEKGDSLKIWIRERKGSIRNTDIFLNRQVLESFDRWLSVAGKYEPDQPVFLPFRHHPKTGKIDLDHDLILRKKPLATETVAARMKGYMENSGIQSQGRVLSPHALRHTAATNMFERGIPLPLISHILGHTSIEITRMYINPRQSHLRNFDLLY